MKYSLLIAIAAAFLNVGCSGSSSSGDSAGTANQNPTGNGENPEIGSAATVAVQGFKGTWTGNGRRVVTTQAGTKSYNCKTAITINEITPSRFEFNKSQACSNSDSSIESQILDISENRIYYNNRVVGNAVKGLINFIIEENGTKDFTRLQVNRGTTTYEYQSTNTQIKVVETATLSKIKRMQ